MNHPDCVEEDEEDVGVVVVVQMTTKETTKGVAGVVTDAAMGILPLSAFHLPG